MSMQQFCLRWNNHQPNFISVFSSLLNSASLVDVTLAAEGRHLQAHKVVLSACSSYFQSLFTVNPCQHPIVILKDVKFADLKVMVDFMYYGEVNVSQEQLPHILKTAEMLKIKGLAEMPDSTSLIKSQSGSSERAELLTPGDSNWSSDLHRRSLSPSPCPLSPNSRRKRLRKSSTGSGSGSTERTSEEHPGCEHGHGVIKPDPGFSSDCSTTPQRAIKQHSSTDSEHRDSSQESGDGDVILQIPTAVQQQHQAQQSDNMEPSLVELTCPSSTSGSGSHPSSASDKVGTKRGRLLMRQPRVKKEMDVSQQSPECEQVSTPVPTAPSSPPPTQHQPLQQFLLSVPHTKIERQCSEPAVMPSISPPPSLSHFQTQSSQQPPPLSLLTVPGQSGLLVKQHSHPLLPSQTSQSPRSNTPVPVHFLVPVGSSGSSTTTAAPETERASSPVVIVTDPLSTDPPPASRPEPTPTSATATLRVRTEELKRSVSSPQAGSPRASHCPVVRQGPALGCNFCWNTVDAHGRILRRKTKYHCPECQTNLCIVPCFQHYHERHVPGGSDPMALTSSVMRVFPKTSSM